jgi:hypothetical protein
VLIAELLITDVVAEKLARRGVQTDEVEQLPANGAVFVRNPHPRVRGSRFMIGPTDGGRLLTVVIVPNESDDGTWFAKTAWESSRRERATYLRRS